VFRIASPMKLLLFGSLFVVAGIVAWAAIDWTFESVSTAGQRIEVGPPVFGFVNAGSQPNGTSETHAIVWQTSTAPEDCAYVIDRRKRDERRQIAALIGADGDFSPAQGGDDPCAPFELGAVQDGIKVEIVGECGRMAKVRILSGALQGRQGCLETERLSDVGE
jgi:hypothetical protein